VANDNFRMRSAPVEGTYHVLTGLEAPSGGVVAGQMGQATDTYYVVVTDVAEGEEFAAAYHIERIELPCNATTTGEFTVGEKVYIDLVNQIIVDSAAASALDLIGVVTKAPVLGATWVEIEFDGKLHIVA